MKKLYKFLLNKLPRPLLIRLSYVFRWFAPLIYKGNKVQCNVCDMKFRKFLSYGAEGHHRENVLCPNCLTLERHRLMWLFLQKKTNFFKDDLKVLHIAPEQCFYSIFRTQRNLKYLTADLYSPLADVKMDLHNAPFEDNSFDVVFCNHVLEHVEDDKKCMSELYRVMKPGGFGIFQVPIDYTRENTYEDKSITSPEDREKHFWQKDHVRLYGLDYPTRLSAAGFKVTCDKIAKEISVEESEKLRLPMEEEVYYCVK
jgi:SAM-dependent methyltransferase